MASVVAAQEEVFLLLCTPIYNIVTATIGCDKHPMNAVDQLESLERALQEIEALKIIYDDNVVILSDLDHAKSVSEEAGDKNNGTPAANLRLDLQISLLLENGTAVLQCGMPPGYPLVAAALPVIVSVDGSSRTQRDNWSAKLTARAEALTGNESLMDLAQELVDLVSTSSLGGNLEEDEEIVALEKTDEPTLPLGFSRRWIWVHHITDSSRKKSIVQEATDLKLGGFLKPGYPGVVVVEGDHGACDDFVVWIKGNKSRPGGFGRNWGHHVRGQVESLQRRLPVHFSQIDENMSLLGSLCKEHDVEDEFLEYVFQHKS